MDMGVQVSLQDPDFNCSGPISNHGIDGSYSNSIFNYFSNRHTDPQHLYHFSFLLSVPSTKVSNSPHLIFCSFLQQPSQWDVTWYPFVVQIYISLRTNDVEHGWPFVYIFEKCLFKFFVIFFNCIVCFPVVQLQKFFIYSGYYLLIRHRICKSFLTLYRLLFNSVYCVLLCTEVLNFNIVVFLYFHFCYLYFWYHNQEILEKSNVMKVLHLDL